MQEGRKKIHHFYRRPQRASFLCLAPTSTRDLRAIRMPCCCCWTKTTSSTWLVASGLWEKHIGQVTNRDKGTKHSERTSRHALSDNFSNSVENGETLRVTANFRDQAHALAPTFLSVLPPGAFYQHSWPGEPACARARAPDTTDIHIYIIYLCFAHTARARTWMGAAAAAAIRRKQFLVFLQLQLTILRFRSFLATNAFATYIIIHK